jgi:hypothetical protein
MPTGDADVYDVLGRGNEPPEQRRRAVTEERLLAAGEHGRELTRSWNLNPVPNKEHAAVKTVQQAAPHSARDRRAPNSSSSKLPRRDHAQLALADPDEHAIAATVSAHKVTQSVGREDLGHKRVLGDRFWRRSSACGDIGQLCSGWRGHAELPDA